MTLSINYLVKVSKITTTPTSYHSPTAQYMLTSHHMAHWKHAVSLLLRLHPECISLSMIAQNVKVILIAGNTDHAAMLSGKSGLLTAPTPFVAPWEAFKTLNVCELSHTCHMFSGIRTHKRRALAHRILLPLSGTWLLYDMSFCMQQGVSRSLTPAIQLSSRFRSSIYPGGTKVLMAMNGRGSCYASHLDAFK